jgi:Response regulators consisting of a CheY-like receiver domain and a winged-helix DNA-binding domain
VTEGFPVRLLVVEDDPDIRALIRALLRKEGAVIVEAEDGEQAITKLQQNDFDAVILDIMLPRHNGFEVAELIRTLPHPPRVIVVSAIARHFAEAFDSDCIVLQKPFNNGDLLAALRGQPVPRPDVAG